MSKNVKCGCGYGEGANHLVGVGNCCRYHVTDPYEIPRNRRRVYMPQYWEEPVVLWDIGDHWVTEYTLFHQRGYHQDENGNWTRPKSKDSIISIGENW